MGLMTDQETAASLFDELRRLQAENARIKEQLREVREAFVLKCDAYNMARDAAGQLLRERDEARSQVAATGAQAAQPPLSRQQTDAILEQHFPLESLLPETGDAFEAAVRDVEQAHGIGPATGAPAAQPKTNQCGETCERAMLCAICAQPLAAGGA